MFVRWEKGFVWFHLTKCDLPSKWPLGHGNQQFLSQWFHVLTTNLSRVTAGWLLHVRWLSMLEMSSLFNSKELFLLQKGRHHVADFRGMRWKIGHGLNMGIIYHVYPTSEPRSQRDVYIMQNLSLFLIISWSFSSKWCFKPIKIREFG